jgi:hypothetical protein
MVVRTCETCKKNFNKLEEAEYAITLDSLPAEEAYLCEYHAMSLVQDLARHRANFKLKSLIDGTVYLPTYNLPKEGGGKGK